MMLHHRLALALVGMFIALLCAAGAACGGGDTTPVDGDADVEQDTEGGEIVPEDGDVPETRDEVGPGDEGGGDVEDGEATTCTTAAECNDGNPCTVDQCDEVCIYTNVADGSECDDGYFCSLPGTCAAGECVGAEARTCDDGDLCTQDTCDEASHSCRNLLVPRPGEEGPPGDATCTDGLDNDCDRDTDAADRNCIPCTGAAECDDSNACTNDLCVDSACQNAPVDDGMPCDDDQFCTVNEACGSGVCRGGAPRYCTAEVEQCNRGLCNEATDVCVPDPLADGSPCDDGTYCTTGESCTGGVCGDGTARDCSSLDDQCVVGTCDDVLGTCVAAPVADGTTCDDGAFCSAGDACADGVCTGGAARDCSALTGACNTGACDEIGDTCYASPAANGTTCSDGLACNTGEACASGVCTGGAAPDCSSLGDACHVGVCTEAAHGCVAQALPGTTACEDGLFCTTGETCATGACAGGTARTCDDADRCTTDTCVESADRCDHVLTPAPGTERRGTTSCTDGIDNDCDRLTDAADPDCALCTGSADCNDSNACTVDTCNTATGTCSYAAAPSGTTCDDGLYCTTTDHCTGTTCGGTARDCSALTNPCNTGRCNEATDACVADRLPDTTTCEDGAYCTVGDHCTAGTCTAGGARDCSASANSCNSASCNETTDRCAGVPLPDTTLCDDGLYCTLSDHCAAGTCTGGGARDCSAFTATCVTGACNEAGGTCYGAPVTEGTACDDGDPATPRDICIAGVCEASVCGDSYLDTGGSEHCDDGNTLTESCSTPPVNSCVRDCSIRQDTCGDGTTQTASGEQCDDGDEDSMDACTTSCTTNDHDIGAPCTCTGSGCSLSNPTAGTINGCSAIVVPSPGPRLACPRSGSLLGNNMYFPAGMCTLYASRCSGMFCGLLGSGGNIGEYDSFDAADCPTGSALVLQTLSQTGITLRVKACMQVCTTDAECRWNEYDTAFSVCGQWQCMSTPSIPGLRTCFDARTSAP